MPAPWPRGHDYKATQRRKPLPHHRGASPRSAILPAGLLSLLLWLAVDSVGAAWLFSYGRNGFRNFWIDDPDVSGVVSGSV